MTRFALDGMVALVTGGGGMIGRAVAQRMAAGGARLALADSTAGERERGSGSAAMRSMMRWAAIS